MKPGVNEILVLGEHTIFVLRETDGELLMQVCDYMCVFAYAVLSAYMAYI